MIPLTRSDSENGMFPKDCELEGKENTIGEQLERGVRATAGDIHLDIWRLEMVQLSSTLMSYYHSRYAGLMITYPTGTQANTFACHSRSHSVHVIDVLEWNQSILP